MKFILTILTPIAIAFHVNAQKFSIAADKMNMFYVGVDNPLSVTVENYPAASVIVKGEGGQLTGSNGNYVFQAQEVGKASIMIYKKVNGKLKEIGRNDFRVKHIPLPFFKIGSGKNKMTREEMRNLEFATAVDDILSKTYSVEKFSVCVIYSDTCRLLRKTNTGSQLNDDILTAFRKLNPNDIVIFSDIVARKQHEEPIDLEPVMIRIVE